jgi:uncharacterized protein YjeT (DUF2065 family)
MWEDLFRALCLVLVIEGLFPFLAPDRWREMLLKVSGIDTRTLRIAGAVAVSTGLILLHLLRE